MLKKINMDPKEFYSSRVSPYEYFSDQAEDSMRQSTMLGELIFQLPIPSDGLLVDLGCGPGTSFAFCMEKGKFKECLAIDYSESMLLFFKQNLEKEVAHMFKFQQANLEEDKLDTDDNTATLVISQKTLLYLKEINNFFKESSRVLQSGKYLAFNFIGHNQEKIRRVSWEPTKSFPVNAFIHNVQFMENKFHQNNFRIAKKVEEDFDEIQGLDTKRVSYVLQKS